ncbi:MAG: Smr/MutS family protein [Leptothrix sp. (in: b-proteobacteria)]
MRDWADLGAIRRQLTEQRLAAEEAARRAAAEAAERQRERELFVRSIGAVTPLPRHHDRAELDRPRPLPVPRQRELDDAMVMRSSLSDEFDAESLLETDDQLSYRRRGLGPDVMKKLRLGHWTVQGQIDLHGLTRDDARETLAAFLVDAGKRGWRCVRVVHGKGLGSPGRQPVLKGKVRNWLVQRLEVLAFTQARGPDGGAGALIVLLDSTTRPQRARLPLGGMAV